MIQFVKEFDYIKIRLASPVRILQWSNRKLPNGQFDRRSTKIRNIKLSYF